MAIDDNASYELTGYQVKDLASKIRAKADSNSLASVATSGLYSDLTGAPTIPTVYNGTLTLQQNGSTLGTFSANQSSNETINFISGGKLNNLWWGIEDPERPDYKNLYAGDPTTLPVLISFPGVSTMFDEGMIQLIDQVDNQTYVVVSIDSTNYSILAVRADGSSGAKEFITFSTTSGSSSTWTKTVTSLEPFTGATSGAAGTSGLVPAPTTSDPDKFLKGDGSWGTPTGTTYSDFTGATASVAGAHGLVPAPAAGDEGKALKGDGTWGDFSEEFVIMKYGESNAWAKFIDAYSKNKIVYCRASSNANPGTGSQTRLAFMAYVSNETTPTNVEFQYVRSVGSKTVTQPVDQVFVYKLTNASGGTWSVETRDMAPKIAAGTGINVSYSNGTYTISLA